MSGLPDSGLAFSFFKPLMATKFALILRLGRQRVAAMRSRDLSVEVWLHETTSDSRVIRMLH
jgi:hypothetical protein